MEPEVKPQGKIRRGWELTKSAWKVLKLDKEITLVPVIGSVVSLIALAPFAVIGYMNARVVRDTAGNFQGLGLDLGHWTWPFWAALYVSMAFISNLFAAAIAHAAITRFKGGDPTVRSSLKAAWKRADSILAYSTVTTTVGYVLSMLEQRLPLAGKIATWLFSAAWSVANFFAIPVIVTSEEHIGPFKAVRQSAATIRKVWGESIVSQGLLGAISLIAVFGYLILGGGLVALTVAGGLGSVMIGGSIGLSVLGFIVLALVFNVLGSIAKAAVYYFAVTGESPQMFNRELLHQAMTRKKARKLFGGAAK